MKRWWHRTEFYAGLATGALLAAALFVVLSLGPTPSDASRNVAAARHSQSPEGELAEGVAKRAVTPAPPSRSPLEPVAEGARPSIDEAFAPADVIGNLDCVMAVGGPENDTAVVLLPGEEDSPKPAAGSRFAVLDKSGHLFGDALPFMPSHQRLGRRADGGVVAGFGELGAKSRTPGVPEPAPLGGPVRIYLDGHVVYSSDNADDFQIAADGSSFFVHELLGGGTSRLVVHDLDRGRVEYIPTDEVFEVEPSAGEREGARNEDEGAYGMWYSLDFREVQVAPLRFDRAFGTRRFYPVGGAEDSKVRVFQLGGRAASDFEQYSDGALFASSETVYFADRAPFENRDHGQPWRISRVDYDFDRGVSKTLWSRRIRFRGFNGRMTLSPNGAWLALGAWPTRVLDTATGHTVFEFSNDWAAAHERLGSVLSADAGQEQAGRFTGARFLGDSLLLSRHIGSTSCHASDSRVYRECLAMLRREQGEGQVVDVFDMNTITLDSQPDVRVEVGPDIPCGAGDFPLRGLQVHDGELTFLTTRR